MIQQLLFSQLFVVTDLSKKVLPLKIVALTICENLERMFKQTGEVRLTGVSLKNIHTQDIKKKKKSQCLMHSYSPH